MRGNKQSRVLKCCWKGGSGSGGGGKGGGGGGSQGKQIASDGSHDGNSLSLDEYAEQVGVSREEAARLFDAVKDFTQGSDQEIRDNQKAGIPDRRADAIEAYLKSVPSYKGEIYRGLNFNSESERDTFLMSVQKNGGMSLAAMSSFSSNPSIAESFARTQGKGYTAEGYGVKITVQNNQSGKSIRSISHNSQEDEVLVGKGARYRIVSTSVTQATKATRRTEATNSLVNIIVEEY